MKILVTGAGGMLAKTLIPCLQRRGHDVLGLTKDDLDITDLAAVQAAFDKACEPKPTEPIELVIHCAAYTKVDQAEEEQEAAYLVNGRGTENIALAAASHKLPMLYVSTDYVFDGKAEKPYQPNDQPAPLSIYGKSKLAGEVAVQKHLKDFYIVRTSWLYGLYGKNFVDTIEKLASEQDQLKVVADQLGSPTSTITLSEIIADLIETGQFGIYHATDEGIVSWFEFAEEIVKGLPSNRARTVSVSAIATRDMPRPAPRPAYSGLCKNSLKQALGRELTPWQVALHQYQTLKASQLQSLT
jgi:dTDP-4-dehydrorhamnose reductase